MTVTVAQSVYANLRWLFVAKVFLLYLYICQRSLTYVFLNGLRSHFFFIIRLLFLFDRLFDISIGV
jgi:hypothetical protein